MLYRLGRLGYLALFVLVIYGWTRWHIEPREVLHHGWDATREKLHQGASLAEDLFTHSHSLNKPAAVESVVSASNIASQVPTSAIVATVTPSSTLSIEHIQADSPYAYVFYATMETYACSVLVNIERLQNVLHTRHRIFVLVSPDVPAVYIQAFQRRHVTVSIQTPPELAEGSSYYYHDCLLKMLAFKMHRIEPSIKKVIALDSDQLIMQNLDHLFESSVQVDLAAPRAYWIARDVITTAFMLISLSDQLWETVEHAMKTIKTDKYDMDLIQDLLADTVMMLPGSFVTLNSHWEDWNLPKWFHTTETKRNVTQGNTPNNRTSANAPSVLPEIAIKRDLSHSPHSEAPPSRQPQGAEEEQIRATSGDIFSYLDTPVKASPPSEADDDSIRSAYGSPPPTEYHEIAGNRIDYEAQPPFDAEDQIELKFQYSTPAQKQQLPLFKALYDLASAVSVLHFSGLGKPWTYTVAQVAEERPGSHPLFVEQFRIWRETALRVCPAGVLSEL